MPDLLNIHELLNKQIYLKIKDSVGTRTPFREVAVTNFLANRKFKWINLFELSSPAERFSGSDFILSFTQDERVFIVFYQAKKIEYGFDQAVLKGFNRKYSKLLNFIQKYRSLKTIDKIIEKIFSLEIYDVMDLSFFVKINSFRGKKILIKNLKNTLKSKIKRQAAMQVSMAKNFNSPAYHIFYTWFKDKLTPDDVVAHYSSFFVKTETMLKFFKKENYTFYKKRKNNLIDKFKTSCKNKTLKNLFNENGFFFFQEKLKIEDILSYYNNLEDDNKETYQIHETKNIFELLKKQSSYDYDLASIISNNKGIAYIDQSSGNRLILKLKGMDDADITRALFKPQFIINIDLDVFNLKE
ncbi:MAG: hypothetical protein K2Q18_02400 [Bdellovibrionales bacterium]|nr:hypothetical protein [Bdellovibrionales bacterium]